MKYRNKNLNKLGTLVNRLELKNDELSHTVGGKSGSGCYCGNCAVAPDACHLYNGNICASWQDDPTSTGCSVHEGQTVEKCECGYDQPNCLVAQATCAF
ncbi:MAG: hypothetical protein QM528_04380 [Phycisphaerales bacterium]|nr:hypothetical protein [Phycisphaerales bacterium]